MAAVPPPDEGSDGSEPIAGAPRWVKITGLVALAVAVLVVVLIVTGVGGEHGPGRHSDGDGDRPTQSTPEDGHQPPIEHAP